jgi:hypothetical protein
MPVLGDDDPVFLSDPRQMQVRNVDFANQRADAVHQIG